MNVNVEEGLFLSLFCDRDLKLMCKEIKQSFFHPVAKDRNRIMFINLLQTSINLLEKSSSAPKSVFK